LRLRRDDVALLRLEFKKRRFQMTDDSAGVIGAGLLLLYNSQTRVNSWQTMGAVGQRDVYRDAEVKTAEVNAIPGSAPVAARVLLESKEFRALAKDEAFHGVITSEAFLRLAQNGQFYALLKSPAFFEMAQNKAFVEQLRHGSMNQVVAELRGGGDELPKESLAKSGSSADGLRNGLNPCCKSRAFQELMKDAAFQNLVANQALSRQLARLMTSDSFARLVRKSEFQDMASRASFEDGMKAYSSGEANSEKIK
jgi:hypothetical protein